MQELFNLFRVKQISWKCFLRDSDPDDWQQLDFFAELLPLSHASTDDLIQWLSPVIQRHENDGSLHFFAQYIYEWIVLNENVATDVLSRLDEIARNGNLNRFLPLILRALKVAKGVNTDYLVQRLKNHIEPSNAFHVLYGLGFVSQEDEHSTAMFYDLLRDKTDSGVLKLSEFIRVSNYLQLYRSYLLERIQSVLPSLEESETLNAVIELVRADKGHKHDPSWYRSTCRLLVTKRADAITGSLDWLVQAIAEDELEFAYDLIELRMKVMAHLDFLRQAFVSMVGKNTGLFQVKLIAWLQAEDHYLHAAVRYMCSINELPESLFDVPSGVFTEYDVRNKLFIAFKVVGYVYSMEHLQALILSLIKAINEPSRVLEDSLYHILTEYIVYNYRTTLDLINKLLTAGGLQEFARQLLQRVSDEYESYFAKLNQIEVDKELRPKKEYLLLKGFYMNRQFASVPKAVRENSISRLLKNTQINSNKWAIRRPGQIKHEVRELAHITYSSEFPSGEYLNPVFQEEIRRTYQTITKDEIDIY